MKVIYHKLCKNAHVRFAVRGSKGYTQSRLSAFSTQIVLPFSVLRLRYLVCQRKAFRKRDDFWRHCFRILVLRNLEVSVWGFYRSMCQYFGRSGCEMQGTLQSVCLSFLCFELGFLHLYAFPIGTSHTCIDLTPCPIAGGPIAAEEFEQ